MSIQFTLNGKSQTVDVSPNMPLLWVLRDTLGMINHSEPQIASEPPAEAP